MGSFKCNLCGRSMPPRVYEFHLKKSHTPEEVQKKVEANEQELHGLIIDEEKRTIEAVKLPKQSFDWGEVYPCNTCGEEYPAKAMPFHSWVKHRV